MSKKIVTIIVALIIIGGIGAYLWIHNSSDNNLENNSLDDNSSEEDSNNLNTSDMNILIAYYSYTGNTEGMAEEIQNQTQGDLFKIERKAEYSDLYTEAEDEINNNERPELASAVDNMDDYDVIFIGFPVWWDNAPAMINSFLESYDLADKVVIPFCTSSSDGIEGSMPGIRNSAKNATVLDGLRLSGSDASTDSGKEEIASWLSGLGIFGE